MPRYMSSSKSSGAFDRLVSHVGTELDQWVAGLRGDAALVVLVAGHVDVSVQAPCWSPAVLDDVVVAAHGISSITHRQDTMVQLSAAALGLVIHAMFVHLERQMSSVDGNRYGSNCSQRLCQRLLILRWNIYMAGTGGANAVPAESARRVPSFVSVAFFSIDAVVPLHVVEGEVHDTSVTTLITF